MPIRAHPELADKNQQQLKAYREMGNEDLFDAQQASNVLGFKI